MHRIRCILFAFALVLSACGGRGGGGFVHYPDDGGNGSHENNGGGGGGGSGNGWVGGEITPCTGYYCLSANTLARLNTIFTEPLAISDFGRNAEGVVISNKRFAEEEPFVWRGQTFYSAGDLTVVLGGGSMPGPQQRLEFIEFGYWAIYETLRGPGFPQHGLSLIIDADAVLFGNQAFARDPVQFGAMEFSGRALGMVIIDLDVNNDMLGNHKTLARDLVGEARLTLGNAGTNPSLTLDFKQFYTLTFTSSNLSATGWNVEFGGQNQLGDARFNRINPSRLLGTSSWLELEFYGPAGAITEAGGVFHYSEWISALAPAFQIMGAFGAARQ